MLENIKERIKELKPFYARNAVKDIFSWKELENLFNLRPFNNQDRFRANFKEIYEWPYQAWVSDINCFPPSIIKEIIKKYHCHITDASRVNEKINTICEELDVITGFPTDAHIYFDLTEEQNSGFGIHLDYSHNLMIQVEGISNMRVWNIKDYPREFKIKHLDEEPIFDIIMEPGDVCYAPAHYCHEVKSLTKRLSVSFPSCTKVESSPQEREWIRIP